MQVRAGAREPEQAYQFLRNAIAFGLLPKDAEKQITVVNFDLEDPDSLPQAIGNASKVPDLSRTSSDPLAAAAAALNEGEQASAPVSGRGPGQARLMCLAWLVVRLHVSTALYDRIQGLCTQTGSCSRARQVICSDSAHLCRVKATLIPTAKFSHLMKPDFASL